MFDVTIIGAGVVGCLISRELSKYNLKVLVLEKNNDVGNETSAANSAIVHSGYDPLPNTNKEKFNVAGNAMFDDLCKELDVSFKRIGSITVAFDDSQIQTLKELQKRASENGVETVLLNKEEVHKEEPFLSDGVVGGLLARSAAIIDPFNLCVHAMENAIDNGVKLIINEEVKSIEKIGTFFKINNKFETKVIINCAGIYSDEINSLVNQNDDFKILPRKGEYLVLDHFSKPFVTHTIFMVPTEKGKGVLITPTTSGNYLIGPSAELVEKDDNSTDKATILTIKQLANQSVANIPYWETIRTFAGIRSTPSTHDFIIEESKTEGFINVAGIESPGLASSPAIAKYVAEELISKHFNLEKKENFNPNVKSYIHIKKLSIEEKNKLCAENNDYGKIICKCEQVSKGEILDCLKRSCPPHSIKGLKRRLRVGFGRCQGGMCQGDTLKILADFYQCDLKDIPYDNNQAYILNCKTKEEI